MRDIISFFFYSKDGERLFEILRASCVPVKWHDCYYLPQHQYTCVSHAVLLIESGLHSSEDTFRNIERERVPVL